MGDDLLFTLRSWFFTREDVLCPDANGAFTVTTGFTGTPTGAQARCLRVHVLARVRRQSLAQDGAGGTTSLRAQRSAAGHSKPHARKERLSVEGETLQGILLMIVFISSAEKPRNVCVRMLPREPSFRSAAVTASSDPSTTVTRS
jgi:hypothetical protein